MALSMEGQTGMNPQALLMKTVHDIQDCVQELKKESADSGNAPITDDSQTLQRFCAKLEFLLQAGLKSRSSLLGGKKDYWNYFCDCLASNKGLNDGIRFVKSVSELKTNLGKGRAFIRFCLVQKRLADSLQQCIYNNRVTNDWYNQMAVWIQPRAVSPLINILYDLNDLQFDLSPHGYDLDASWPTFARKTFGGAGGFSWAPPSRSTSISSLASLPQQSDSFGYGSSLSSHSEPELERVKAELNETENEKLHLQVKLETIEDERRNWLKKVQDLEVQLSKLREEKTALEIQCAKSESEMKTLEEKYKGSEAVLQEKLKSAETSMQQMQERLESVDTAGAAVGSKAAATTDILNLEHKMKLVAVQKELAASKLELKNANLQLQMKMKIDEGKTKLIDTLEARLTKSETSKRELLDKVESFFVKHEREEQGHSDILDQMKHLKAIMAEKEKANESLKKINSELREMLKDLETKSKKISVIAKEKVLKYVDQIKQLQETVDTLQKMVAEKDILLNGAQGIDIDAKIKEAIEDKHKLLDDKQSLKLEVESLKTSLQEVQETMKDLQKKSEKTSGSTSTESAQVSGEDNPIAMMKNLQEIARKRQDSTDGPESPRKTTDEVAKLHAEKADLEVQLMDLKAKNCKLEDTVSDLKQKIIEKDNSIKNLELELANTRTVLTTVENGLDGHMENVGEVK